MTSFNSRAAAAAVLLLAAACTDGTTQPGIDETALLSSAFMTAAPGYDSLSSSFSADGNTGVFGPRGRGRPGPPGESLGRSDLMGGGMRGEFSGDVGMGPGMGRGPFGDGGSTSNCTTFNAATGIVTCTPIVRDSLTIARTFKYSTAAGVAQSARDSATTDRIETTRSVTGTTTFTPGRREGFGKGFGPRGFDSLRVDITTARTTVSSSSSRVTTGLAAGSTARTVNGASSAREVTEGTTTANGAFTSTRVMGDTTRGLIVPVLASGYPYPTAGTVIRAMSVTVTYAGATPVSSVRREVITYDGSTTARISITKDGETKACTLALPRGRPVCP